MTYVDVTAGAGVTQTRAAGHRRRSAQCGVDLAPHLSATEAGEEAEQPAPPPSWARQSLGL